MSDFTHTHTHGPHPSHPHNARSATVLTVVGIILLLAPVAHLIAVPLGMLGVPVAKEWAAYSYDPFSANILLAIVALAPGYFCLLAAFHRAPLRSRLVTAIIAPMLVLTYAVAASLYLVVR
ncbi:hypothetical protein [Rothia nasimurium]|uniref:hypothetical protein n=1 Tax=Rothia nasimurium TaxID=85336 RepID=UPI001F2FFC81|nr:hypothetical protein [Rothia nasimurium]